MFVDLVETLMQRLEAMKMIEQWYKGVVTDRTKSITL